MLHSSSNIRINKVYYIKLYICIICCQRSAYPVPFPITVHALTWFHSSLIEHTCNHLPPPFISSLTSVTHRLVLRLHGCSSLHWSMSSCLPVYPWNSSLPVDTQVYKHLILFILLPELSSLYLFCWKPFLSYFNKFPFDLHLPVCLL